MDPLALIGFCWIQRLTDCIDLAHIPVGANDSIDSIMFREVSPRISMNFIIYDCVWIQ